MKLTRTHWAIILILAVLVIDQVVKIWVKTSFYLGEDIEVLPFFHLRFIQNNGMAFGVELGHKMFLTLFRLAAVGFLAWYMVYMRRHNRQYPTGYIMCVALVIAGAAGNIIDCMIYGEIFNNPYPPGIAQFVPWGEGYSTLGQGLVVDMLYFPLFDFNWPSWLPLIGGKHFSFFDPVFNVADSAITVGMIAIILFYSKYIGRAPAPADE